MFYDKEIMIMESHSGYRDEFGIWHEGVLNFKELIAADVQPITKELAFKEFGTDEAVKYRVFCDHNTNLITGSILKYQGYLYRIISLTNWDDYMDFIVGDYNG